MVRHFERIFDVVEPVEEYRYGGYHPVHFGDLFKERYRIEGKLAFGQFSTVWLAFDQSRQQYVALKILKSGHSKAMKELDIFLQLEGQSLQLEGRRYCLELLDHFQHKGPNGIHLCLVFPVMMSDGQAMTVRGFRRQPGYMQAISRQILKGLHFIHAAGFIHGDLQPANVLFSLVHQEFDLKMLDPPECCPVKWLNREEMDDSAPGYLVVSQRPRGMLDDTNFAQLTVKIGDLGGATSSKQSDVEPVTPTALRAPELIHHSPWDVGIDIWALGCLLFQLATSEPLFPLCSFGLEPRRIDDEHESMIKAIIDDDDEEQDRFQAYLSERLPPDFGADNVEFFASFLRSMLQRDSRCRKSTGELLAHPFLLKDG